MRIGKVAALVAAGAVLAVALAGCGPAIIRVEQPSRTDEPVVELQGAEALDAELRIAVGELRVSGGSSKAMEARFDYRPDSWKPEVRYSVEGTAGELRVEQPPRSGASFGDAWNTWDVRLNDTVPLRLQVKTGVGKSRLELGDLRLTRLDVVGGVGETSIDLGRVARNDLTVDVQGGVGKVVLRVPREAGVRVTGQKDGVGDFEAVGFAQEADGGLVNENFGKPGVKRYDVRILRGVGDVTIEQQ